MRARVTWFGPDFGGRASGPPTEGEYRPNALFLSPSHGAGGPTRVEYASVRFIMLRNDPSDVELDFWSPQDLSSYVYDGSPFLVMEASQPVAFARMYLEDQKPA